MSLLKIACAFLLFSACAPRVVVKDNAEDLAYVEKQIRELRDEMNANMEATVELIKLANHDSVYRIERRIDSCICPAEMK